LRECLLAEVFELGSFKALRDDHAAIICTNLLLVLYIMRCFTFEAVGQVYMYTICVVLPG
jgi:hypothetical protein